jgi:hypothetical protein
MSNFDRAVGVGADDLRGIYDKFLQGSLDEISFYTTTLSSTQISNHFQAASVPEPSAWASVAIGSLCLVGLRRRRALA